MTATTRHDDATAPHSGFDSNSQLELFSVLSSILPGNTARSAKRALRFVIVS
jgi:hypothetical protein